MYRKFYHFYLILFILFSLFNYLVADTIKIKLDHGRIFIVDSESFMYTDIGRYSIAKYSLEGKLMLRFGRKGEGPGDIKRLGWFCISPVDGNIYVSEFIGGNKWITVFSPEGKFLKIITPKIDKRIYDGYSFIKVDKSGNIYVVGIKTNWKKYKDFYLGEMKSDIIKISPTGELLKVIYSTKSPFNCEKAGKGNITIPFHNYLYFDLCKDNLIVKEASKEYVSIFNLDGKRIKDLKVPFKREKVEYKDIKEWKIWLEDVAKNLIDRGILDLKYWEKRIPFPEYKPQTSWLIFCDKKGSVIVLKSSGFDVKAKYKWAKIDLKDGSYKFKITDSKIIFLNDKYIYLEEDEGVIRISRTEF